MMLEVTVVCLFSQSGSVVASSGPRLTRKLVTENFASLEFEEAYTSLFGDENVKVSEDGKTVMLSLHKRTLQFLNCKLTLLLVSFFYVFFFFCGGSCNKF